VWLILLLRRRRVAAAARSLKRKGSIIALAGVAVVGAVMLSLPLDYLNEGRFTTTFWHRTVISLGANPAWPFGNIRKSFDCTRYIPEGLVPRMPDRNGHCIWWDYAIKHDMPVNEAVNGVYGGRYEAVMREAFFEIARLYPSNVLTTFIYYKPKMIVSSISESIQIDLSIFPFLTIALAIVTLANFFAYFIISTQWPKSKRMLIFQGGLLFAASTIPSYLVAWAHPWTTGDLLFYCLFCIGLLSGVALSTLPRALMQLRLLGRALLVPTGLAK